ncbi:MAG TPA: protein-L-isoaspartate(D-aspartate) O-methyltransferase [Candidatus Angelobacter sp.]|jgi:protein-L-isoaspartate(D-aspartate) O-methyltransferase|nr:protein-L-isoaspartate(D-aspartate) O-methyltransferase [Candidatus Angelobacter sp.]
MNGNGTQPFAAERGCMVEQQLRQRGINDERLLAAMAKVPRHEFVSPQNWAEAYADHPIPIAEQQTTSQPYMIAAMVQAAGIKPEDRVLEIGAGSGYQTAVLAELASQVFAVERYASLTETARATLERLGYRNTKVVAGDGSLGLPEAAPFDAIIVSAAAPRIPPALVEQLAIDGRLVVPVGESDQQVVQLVQRNADGTTSIRTLEGCRFVPLIGQQGFAA